MAGPPRPVDLTREVLESHWRWACRMCVTICGQRTCVTVVAELFEDEPHRLAEVVQIPPAGIREAEPEGDFAPDDEQPVVDERMAVLALREQVFRMRPAAVAAPLLVVDGEVLL